MAMFGEDREAYHAFTLADADGDGYITQAELKRYLVSSLRAAGSPDPDGAAHHAMMNAFRFGDKNHDGLLSFDEFKRWFKSHTHAHASNANGHSSAPGMGHNGSSGESFTIQIPQATYCFYEGMYTDPSGVKHKRARAVEPSKRLDPSISSYYKNTFVAYELTMSENGSTWSVLKRYRSMHEFVKTLKKQTKLRNKYNFPPKIIGKVNVEERRVQLEFFFKALFLDPSVREREITRRFLKSSDAEPHLSGPSHLDSLQHRVGHALSSGPSGGMGGGGGSSALPPGGHWEKASVFSGNHTDALSSMEESSQTEYGQGSHGSDPYAAMPGASDPGSEFFRDDDLPDERLRSLGIVLPPPLPNGYTREGAITTVAVKVSAVRDIIMRRGPARSSGGGGGGGGLIPPFPGGGGGGVGGGAGFGGSGFQDQFGREWDIERQVGLQILSQLKVASLEDLSLVTVISLHGETIGGDRKPAYDESPALRATQSLLREVLGKKGSAVLHSHTANELKQFFVQADANGDGKLSPMEIRTALASMGLPSTAEYVQMMLDVADSDGDGTLDYDEFIEFVSTARSEDQETRAAFRQYDLDKDGIITAHELRQALKQQGQSVSVDEAVAIIAQVDLQNKGGINFREFRHMMQENKSAMLRTPGPPGVSDEIVVVTAHIPLDNEALDADHFEAKLTSKGIRLRKHGRKGKVGMRTFRVDAVNEPNMLLWNKAGFKTGARGKFDLSTLDDIVVGEGTPSGASTAFDSLRAAGSPALSNLCIQLRCASGSLILEARTLEEQRVIVDGMRRYRDKLRLGANALQVPGNGPRSKDRLREALLHRFAELDVNLDGYLSPVDIGGMLIDEGVTVDNSDIETILHRIDTLSDGRIDYRAFANEVAALSDPERHAKVAQETEIIDCLSKFDKDGDGGISAIALGQGLAQLQALRLPVEMIQFSSVESDRDGTGRYIDFRRFARIAVGLDEVSNQRLNQHKEERSREVAAQVDQKFYQVNVQKFDPNFTGFITPVNLGQALSQLGSFTQTEVSSILAHADARRDGSLRCDDQMMGHIANVLVELNVGRWKNTFTKWDRNHDGKVTIREMEQAFAGMRQPKTRAELEGMVRSADIDLDGTLSLDEFMVIAKLSEINA